MRCGHACNRATVGHRHDRQTVAVLRRIARAACAAKRVQGLPERRRRAECKTGILQHQLQADPAEGVEQGRDRSVARQATEHARELGFHRVAALRPSR